MGARCELPLLQRLHVLTFARWLCSDELWDNLQSAMLERSVDKVPAVRTEAMRALARLQDPSDVDDAAVKAYLRAMATDTSKDVRKAAVGSVCVSLTTLEYLMQRSRDVNPEVRVHTYVTLAKKVDVGQLTVSQRLALVGEGIRDRALEVQVACAEMVAVWLEQQSFDVYRLLEMLEPEENPEVLEFMLKHLFERADTEKAGSDQEGRWASVAHAVGTVPPFEVRTMTPASALFLRVRCEWLKSKEPAREIVLEKLLPDVMVYSTTLTAVLERAVVSVAEASSCDPTAGDEADAIIGEANAHSFTAHQLVTLANCFDFSEEGGRRQLVSLLKGVLQQYQIGDEFVPGLIKALRAAERDEGTFVREMVELMFDIRTPLEGDSDETKSPDEELLRWLRCLSITKELLRDLRRSKAPPELDGLLTAHIMPAISCEHAAIRDSGLAALGLACMLDSSLAATNARLFLSAASNVLELPDVRVTCLKAILDLLLAFQPETFEHDGDLCVGFDAAIAEVSEFLHGVAGYEGEIETPVHGVDRVACAAQLQQIAAEGLSKLFFAGRTRDVKCLSGLLHTYFFAGTDAQTVDAGDSFSAIEAEDDAVEDAENSINRTKQLLSVFFPAYAALSGDNHLRFVATVVPLLRSTMATCQEVCKERAAERVSSGSRTSRSRGSGKIDADMVEMFDKAVQFIVFLLSAEAGGQGAVSRHCEAVESMLTLLSTCASSDFARPLAKGIASLDYSMGQPEVPASVLSEILDDVCDEISDKVTVRSLSKIRDSLAALESRLAPRITDDADSSSISTASQSDEEEKQAEGTPTSPTDG